MQIDAGLPRRAAAVAAALVLTLAACGGGDDEDAATTATSAATAEADDTAVPGEAVIEIAGFAFGGVTSVPAGSVVIVVNNDTAPHTVTADDGSFDTGTIQPGDEAEITLTAAGSFGFHCEIHGSMTGSITVT